MIPEQSQRVMDLPLEKLHRLIQDLALWGKQKQPCDHILLWHTASWWKAVLCTRSLQAIQEIFLSEKRFCFPYLHMAESIRQLGRPAKLSNTFRSHTYLFTWKINPGKSKCSWRKPGRILSVQDLWFHSPATKSSYCCVRVAWYPFQSHGGFVKVLK